MDLNVSKGEFVSIIGTSGCGKTTLLRIIAGLENEYDGQALLNGVPILKPGLDRGVIFQGVGFCPGLPSKKTSGSVCAPEIRRHERSKYKTISTSLG